LKLVKSMDAWPVRRKANGDNVASRSFIRRGLISATFWLLASATSPSTAQVASDPPQHRITVASPIDPTQPAAPVQDLEGSNVNKAPSSVAEAPKEDLVPAPPENLKTDREFEPPVASYFPMQRPIGQLSIDVEAKAKAGKNVLPNDLAQGVLGAIQTVYAAPASEMTPTYSASLDRRAHTFPYQPLYFEEVNLERYGRSPYRFGAFGSIVRFYATIPAIPYAKTVHNPHQKYHWNWPYEAGWSAPRVRETPPLQLNAGLVEAGAITGVTFLVP
jgi:hypothetical protein